MLMSNMLYKVNHRRKSITWEIKTAKETTTILIKDESLILAWDKLDHPIGNNNNPPCKKRKKNWKRHFNNSCKCLFQIIIAQKLIFIIWKHNRVNCEKGRREI